MKRLHHLEIFFYRALLIFCIIIKKAFSGDCGKPYFEPYLTNPRNPNRIVGGWVAKPYSFPWTVHILTHVSGLLYESCGGSLISLDSTNASDTILTASHCVRVNNRLVNANAITVAAGVFNIKKLNEPHRVTSKVLAYISDNFDDVSMENDIAVLRLKVEIQHSEYISPVCLPKQNQKLPWGEMCFVSGWGLTRESGKPSSKLRQVGIPILRNSNCPFIDADDMFCAGDMSGGKDSCQGDSGGPLVCKLNDTFVQMGIVSFGDGCARKDHPGIYTKVPHYVKWIYNQAAKLPDSSTSSEIREEKPDYSNDFHHSWGSVGNYFHFPFFDSSDDIWNNENFGNENSPFSQLPWSFLSEPMPLFRSRSSFINRDVEEEAGDWSPYSTNQHFQTYYGLPHIGEEGHPHYPLENWPDMNGKYPLHHHSEFHPPYLYSNRPSMNEENQPQYTSKNRLEMSENHHFGKSYRKFRLPYSYANGPSINGDHPSSPPNFQNHENRPTKSSTYCGNPHFEPYLANPHYPNQIVGEWVARPYSFPWTVHVLAHISGFWYESCGGSLISFDYSNASDTVLTSSHCVRVNNRLVDANAITVTAGAFDIRDLNEPHRVTSKVLAYMSDNFGDVGKPNDVAMLRLKVKIPHSEYISPVCLPYTYQDMPWGETCFLSGWDLSKESGKPSSKLYQVGIPILQKNNCRFVDAYDIFCVGDVIAGIDPSQVDSGGPLVCKLNDSYVQIGIVSFRYGHAGKDHVGIYSKVPYYLNWIYNQLWWLPDSFNSSYAGVEAYALNMKRWHPFDIPFHNAFLLFCIIIKETFSQYCGNPYFEPYLTNPHYPNQIVGEWVARPYSFPWTVHVLAHISGFWYESCVGSLISFDYTNASDTVLTSSHCVRVNNRLVDANAITVTAGAFNIRELNEPHRVTSKVLAYMSDNFGDVSKPNDVALLRLKVKIPHSHYISSVCLPYHSYQEMPWGETCFLSGWGFTRGRPLSELRQVGIPILRKSNCRFTDAYDIFCAGDMGGGNYSFQIDSGGPLVCKLNDSYVQIGIVSFGYNHAGKHHPGIFSNVPFYVNWIYNQLSWLPDSFNSSDIGGEESDCPDDCYHPWRSVFNHFKHRKASFHMDSLESTEGDGSDWSPYSINQHYQSNYDGSQSGEGNRPPHSHSHRPTMNENRPPPPPDSRNFAMQPCGIVIL
ncbi:Serine protease 30 [Trichinella nativa]|uniref:Serine protease 30 n=1 Tax=Trichinella nativa TaxID=6335 RepID=A0A0V1LJD3_9BILA|nr:Serine protease 30 [Trichinella nativa]